MGIFKIIERLNDKGANRIRPGKRSAGGVSWLVSRPRKKLTKSLIATRNYAMAA